MQLDVAIQFWKEGCWMVYFEITQFTKLYNFTHLMSHGLRHANKAKRALVYNDAVIRPKEKPSNTAISYINLKKPDL